MVEKNITSSDKYKSIILVFLMIIGLGIIYLFQGGNYFLDLDNKERVRPGLPAPNFTLSGLDGEVVNLTDYKGKVVFLNIWATWCPPCREEMPSMQKLYNELKGEDFEILAVSIDTLGAKAVAPFMNKFNLTFPALLDTKGSIQGIYGTTGIPESYIIDREGIVVEKVIGAKDWSSPEVIDMMQNLIQKPLSDK